MNGASTRTTRTTRTLLLVLLAAWVPAAGAGQAPSTAFPFAFEDVNPRSATHGETLELAALYPERGLVLQFTASWCQYCRTELPELQKTYRERKLPLILIAADEFGGPDNILIVAERAGVTAPILYVPEDRLEELERHYTYDVLPATYLIDRTGAVRDVHEGRQSVHELLDKAARVLAP